MSPAPSPSASIEIELAHRSPLDWESLAGFFAMRAIPGVESVAEGVYRRTITADGHTGVFEVARRDRALVLRVWQTGSRAATKRAVREIESRVRRMFDLDADPAAIESGLGRDRRLARIFRAHPGLRVPGAWDPFELAVRAVLGQQVSVKAARTLVGRIAERFGMELPGPGELCRVFPPPERLVGADLERLGLTRARASTIRGIAAAIAAGTLRLEEAGSLEEKTARLVALPGIGPWTAEYVAMRALGERDAFPVGDLGLRRALGNGAGLVTPRELATAAEAWRPWRAYAAIALWTGG